MNLVDHLTYNDSLALEWLAKHGITYTVPPVPQQFEIMPLDTSKLARFGYNPSLIKFQDRLLLAYRWHSHGTAATSLVMTELNPDWTVKGHKRIELFGASMEDPRLFEHKGELCMVWVESTWPIMPPVCVIKYGVLKEGDAWSVPEPIQPEYGENDGKHVEKNWVFFSNDDKLLCIYQCSPNQVVLELNGAEVTQEYCSPGLKWGYGAVRGGTTPITHGNRWLRFFHSALDNEPPPWRRRYYIGALSMAPSPPFEQVALSKQPILKGSEADDLTDTQKAECFHRKGQVVFPGGCVEIEGEWFLSIGVNDCQCAIVKITEKDLCL